ncbi:cytosolic phospholipase A2 gamma-like isoform X1 [Thunnus maccoyii]|uniref:cytosolic phospholipase A2 gamma-like isoform X1 n=2 Tax=Thunnus maccoyii TaxID=8240 RepID=UPI001C4AF791|nr:cytosolic phospholipase A2 gamma-like isoform X1 [Thunnus maccoyii]
MQTSRSFLASVICFWLVISGARTSAVGNMEMERDAAASEKPIRQSQSLCAGEQEYVHKRKQVVLESLNSLRINCTTTDSVPHIALLASGGGQRAAVALMGSLYQMEQDRLLDTLLYLGGVSGSTWSMSSLYSDPQWSANMDRAVSRLSGPGVELEEALAWLTERSQEEHFSLTDVWGVMTSAGIMKQMDLRRLSDEASRNATNPYPIYTAIEKHCFSDGPIEGKWFEVSPHEAGFTELGVFVETSLLGSRFESGELLEKKPEMDMVKLQGVLGCALAHEETVREFVPPWLNVPGHIDGAAEEYLRVFNALDKLIALTRSTIKDPPALSDLDKLQKVLEDKVNHNESALLESKSSEERKSLFQQWSLELLMAVETWSQSLEDGPFKTHVSVLTKQIIPLILKWEWGTTRNFLYQYQDSTVPLCLRSEERFHLVDAGLLINVAYPSFLGDKRDIDLIIAPEYSAGNIFETLTLARDYAAKVKKPFPEIGDKILEEREWPNDCYVFEGKEKEPTIIYMPLFNRQNCQDAEEFKAKMEEFSTFQRPFNQEKIEFVLETAKTNMKKNKETLLREINKAALRRQNKVASAAPDR